MEDDKTEQKSVLAQAVLLSTVLTLLILLSVSFIGRNIFSDYLFITLEPRFNSLIPKPEAYISDEARIISAIDKVDKAVVSVIVTKDVPVYEQYYETIDPWGFFGGLQITRIRENGTEEREIGGGTGFIVTSDGLIVTNRHVVSDENARYSVVMTSGTVYGVTVLAKDDQLDIAILKISEAPEEALPTASFGNSSSLKIGQTVIAIGNALSEFQNSVSVGVVSGLSRSIVASDGYGLTEQLNQVIQTDAAINPGNSGGPLLNLDGEVIGVNVATSQGADNIGFALPVAVVQQIVESVKTHGEIVRPYLGVRYVMLDEERAIEYEAKSNHGALIISESDTLSAVEPGSSAERAGLRSGDIILSIDGEELKSLDLAIVLRSKSIGQEIKLEVLRDGVQETIFATLDKAL